MKNRLLCVVLGAAASYSTTSWAQGKAAEGEFEKDMKSAMSTMQEQMEKEHGGGDPDHHFAKMMIPHHQGAIDMARAYLKVGKDPEIRKMAEKVIVAQEKEIGELTAWLKKHPDAATSH